MERIVLYKGASTYGSTRVMIDQLSAAFEDLGFEVSLVDVTQSRLQEQLDRAFRTPCRLVFSFQGFVRPPLGGGLPDYDTRGIPLIVSFLDHPIHVMGAIDAGRGIKSITYAFVSHSHINYVLRYLDHRQIAFLPHGGCRSFHYHPPAFRHRDIDVFFPGTYFDPAVLCEWLREICPPALFELYQEVVAQCVQEESVCLHEVLEDAFTRQGLCLDKDIMRQIQEPTRYADLYIRALRRTACLETLARSGIPVTVCGNGWEDAPFADLVTLYSPRNFEAVLEMMQRAKIVLNMNPNFPDGSHVRVFSGMLGGAAVVTEANRYFSQAFENDRNIISFPWKELGSLADRLRSYLSNPETLEELALSGKSEAERNHGWDSRAKAILSIADRLSGKDRREESFFHARQAQKGRDTPRLQNTGTGSLVSRAP
jgi:hypothetical protein